MKLYEYVNGKKIQKGRIGDICVKSVIWLKNVAIQSCIKVKTDKNHWAASKNSRKNELFCPYRNTKNEWTRDQVYNFCQAKLFFSMPPHFKTPQTKQNLEKKMC